MKTLASVIALLAMLFAAKSAQACSCAEDGGKETLRGFDAAATARLTDVKNEDPQSGQADLVYRVLRVYKNQNLEEGEELVIRSGSTASCGLPRNEGKRYGLRLGRRNGEWTAGLCTLLGPKQLRRAAERSESTSKTASGKCADQGAARS
jgi:hypothetical protein